MLKRLLSKRKKSYHQMDLNDNTVYYARYYVEETKEKLFENIPLKKIIKIPLFILSMIN